MFKEPPIPPWTKRYISEEWYDRHAKIPETVYRAKVDAEIRRLEEVRESQGRPLTDE